MPTESHRLAFRVSYAVYGIAMEIVVWTILVPTTIARILLGRATWKALRERLGWNAPVLADGLLIDAISAGEMRAASALVARAWQPRPLMLTTGTRAGMAVAEELRAAHPRVKTTALLPWDRFAIRSWLRSTRVTAVIVTELDLWPNLFLACRALNVPLFVVNGRMHALAATRYRMAPWFFRPILACASWIGTQEASGRDAFISIGAPSSRVEVAGNLKLDAPVARRALPAAIDDQLRDGRLALAGSTHDPEELWLLCQLAPLVTRYSLRVVIAPRDVSRTPVIVRIAAEQHLACVTWSMLAASGGPAPRWDVLVIDEFGWLPSLYGCADVVFLGGTIAPIGGHNIVEPALMERPIVVGPHVDSIASLVAQMTRADALIQLPADAPAGAFAQACAMLLDQPARAKAMGQAARRVCDDHIGTVERYDRTIAEQMV